MEEKPRWYSPGARNHDALGLAEDNEGNLACAALEVEQSTLDIEQCVEELREA